MAAGGSLEDAAAAPGSSYAAIPARAQQPNMGWLLLAAAHALGTKPIRRARLWTRTLVAAVESKQRESRLIHAAMG